MDSMLGGNDERRGRHEMRFKNEEVVGIEIIDRWRRKNREPLEDKQGPTDSVVGSTREETWFVFVEYVYAFSFIFYYFQSY